jgi:hypothetical protein
VRDTAYGHPDMRNADIQALPALAMPVAPKQVRRLKGSAGRGHLRPQLVVHHGRGSYTIELSHYDIVPGNVMQEIIAKAQMKEEK